MASDANYYTTEEYVRVIMNKSVFYVPFNALLGYIGTAACEGMKRRSKNCK